MNIVNFIKKNSVIHCNNKEDSILLGHLLNDAGYCWNNGESYITSGMRWHHHGKDSCYNVFGGFYADIFYYEGKCYTIYDFAQIKSTNTIYMNAHFIKRIYTYDT